MPGAMSCHWPTLSIVPPAFSGRGRFAGSIAAVIDVAGGVMDPLAAGAGTHGANDGTAYADMETPARVIVTAKKRVLAPGGVDAVRQGAVAFPEGRVASLPAFTASSVDVVASGTRDVVGDCSRVGLHASIPCTPSAWTRLTVIFSETALPEWRGGRSGSGI